MLRPSAALCALAIVSVPVPAHADGGVAWIKETTDKGCYLHEFGNAYNGMATDPNRSGFIWSGACSPGKPINGQGTLYFQNKSPSGAMVWSYTGRIVNGLPDGPMRVLQYVIGADGKWDPAAGTSDPNFSEIVFRQGCPSFAEAQCQPGMVQNVVALQPVTPPHFPLPGRQPAKAETKLASVKEDGDVFDQCVVIESLGPSGIQHMWQLQNNCDAELKIDFCLRARFQAAGDWNLCSALEHRTATLKPLGTYEFPFSLIPDGTGMSDGRVVRNNDKLFVIGHACANGIRPTVGFENKQFKFYRC
jgi:hypothetical protein